MSVVNGCFIFYFSLGFTVGDSFRHSDNLSLFNLTIVLTLEHTDLNGRKRFRFEEMWLEKEKCYELIRSACRGGESILGVDGRMPKMERYRMSLNEWSKKEFKNNLIEINNVKRRLRNLGDQNMQTLEGKMLDARRQEYDILSSNHTCT